MFQIYGKNIFNLKFQEVRLIFPNSQRINRGNYEVKQLVEACRSNDVSDLILLHEHRGVPGELKNITPAFFLFPVQGFLFHQFKTLKKIYHNLKKKK